MSVTPVPLPELPQWGDPGSVALFVVAAFSALVTVLGTFHVVLPAGIGDDVSSCAGIVGLLVSIGVNVWTHRSSHAKVAAAQASSTITP